MRWAPARIRRRFGAGRSGRRSFQTARRARARDDALLRTENVCGEHPDVLNAALNLITDAAADLSSLVAWRFVVGLEMLSASAFPRK